MNSSQVNRIKDQLFKVFAILCTAVGILTLLVLLFDIFSRGLGRLSWDFLNNLPSRFPERSGIYTALYGMVWMLVLTIAISFP
ncbi:MAG TPA: phosphate ABC transporter, permease protein PstA, partial [Anseongella sp.]|nr:phosphate ABC transporter, permease protein PstA [Anseongella sp.]